MTSKKETKTPVLDVRRKRAEMLGGFLRLADHVLTERSGRRSMLLSCSQYYCDEAGDAVHDSLHQSKELLPGDDSASASDSIDYGVRGKHLPWDDNGDAVYAFAPFCNEEGWSEGGEAAGGEEGGGEDETMPSASSPLLLAQRADDGTIRGHWLGALHRAWLDFPGAMADREDAVDEDETPEFAPDAPAPPLEGAEAELHAQVLASPTDRAAREVLSDVWTQRDDPRGEFSALSSAPERTPEMRQRAAALVLEHGRSWLGSLQKVIPLSGALFEHGPFLRSAVVYAADARALGKVAAAPEWATVEEITFASESSRAVTPAMKNLRVVGPLGTREIEPLLDGDWRIEELDFDGSLEALAKVALPLRRLRLRVKKATDLKSLVAAPWWRALQRVELWLPGGAADAPVLMTKTFERASSSVAASCQLAVGLLAGGQRSGWMLTGNAQRRRLELLRPDARLGQGAMLATELEVERAPWEPAGGSDWLHFGLGASSETGAKKKRR